MARSLFHRLLLRSFLAIPLVHLRLRTRAQLDALENTIEILEKERNRSLELGASAFAKIYDASLFVTLFSFDLAVLRVDHASEFRESRKNFYSRQIALQIFEAFQDLPAVFGKEFRGAIQQIAVRKELVTQVGQHISEINQLGKKYSRELEDIRDFAAAHRHKDASKQLAVIRKVNDDKIGRIAFEINVILNELVVVLSEIVKHMGEPRVVIRNIQIPQS